MVGRETSFLLLLALHRLIFVKIRQADSHAHHLCRILLWIHFHIPSRIDLLKCLHRMGKTPLNGVQSLFPRPLLHTSHKCRTSFYNCFV
ncbi:hypothetical protein PENTCL1PPCAC_5890 [Pristionchus entomophagus]|uniref:Secreted protein n=1 Tax=Pristionchus entomophagus TaxID=358040 RepID=A0AAV5SUI8_9BILA|nr:hypothetical protein PENTCL1PPCAC_5890 [Pristionchus entomophagus]